VSFSERGFVSCQAGVVSEAGGAWTKIPASQKSDFGRALSQDFLRCKVGSRDIEFLARKQVFRMKDGHEIHLAIPRTIKTLIKRTAASADYRSKKPSTVPKPAIVHLRFIFAVAYSHAFWPRMDFSAIWMRDRSRR
jgi:hypothetical protein